MTDLVYHGPRLGLGDWGGEGVEDLVQAQTLLGVQLAASPPPEYLQLSALHDGVC